MPWEGWFVIAVIALVFALLAWGRFGTDLVIIAGVSFLAIVDVVVPGADILSVKDALHGMSNEGMITVGVMFVIVAGLTQTGAVAWIGKLVLGRPKSIVVARLKMLLPVTVLSAFMNNTPLVAMFIPVVSDWCKQNRFSPSKLMLPLSYAAILGGTLTLIGTSTNLVVSGMWNEQGLPPIGMFEIAKLGLPCAIVGLIYLNLASRWILPERKPVLSFRDDARSYTVEMTVDPAGPLVGRTIEQAGLRGLPGLYLAEIERQGQSLPAVGPDEKLSADDRLVFVGVVETVVDLQKIRGLKPATNQVVKLDAPRPQRCLIEAVLSNTSPLVGRTIRQGRFRSFYNAVVLAVARNGERITNVKLGDISLEAGDTLLLEAHQSFAEQHRDSRDFYLVSAVENSAPVRHEKAFVALAILAGMVSLVTVSEFMGWPIRMIHGAVIAAGLMVLTRCCSGPFARKSVDWSLLTTIAASLALGKGLETTGAAEFIAGNLISLAGGSPILTLALVYFTAALFTELITNNASAALVFPIAFAASTKLGIDPKPFALCVMMAASACFSTPIGYQTNLMVMSPGGYRFSDYFRAGIPMNFIMWITTVATLPLWFDL